MSYIVFTYQYAEMRRPKIDAVRRTFQDRRDLDALPPSVIRWVNIAATTKREALQTGRPLLRAGGGRP